MATQRDPARLRKVWTWSLQPGSVGPHGRGWVRSGGVPAKSTKLHMKQFVLFSFYLQFPETEQNSFLYTYKAQKERQRNSAKRERGKPTPAGRASAATPWTSSWKGGCGLLVGSCKRTIPQKKSQINPDRQLHGEEAGGGPRRRVAGHTLPLSEASPATPRHTHGRDSCPEQSCGQAGECPL